MKFLDLLTTAKIKAMSSQELIERRKLMIRDKERILEYILALQDEFKYIEQVLRDHLLEMEISVLEIQSQTMEGDTWKDPYWELDNYIH